MAAVIDFGFTQQAKSDQAFIKTSLIKTSFRFRSYLAINNSSHAFLSFIKFSYFIEYVMSLSACVFDSEPLAIQETNKVLSTIEVK